MAIAERLLPQRNNNFEIDLKEKETMAITAETRKTIIDMVVGAYGTAPGTTLLASLVAESEAGKSIDEIATILTTSDTFNAIYPTFQTSGEFGAEFLANILPGVSADALAEGVTIVEGLMAAGGTRADVVKIAVQFLAQLDEADPAIGTYAAAFNNKVEAATYYTLTLEQAAEGTKAALDAVTADQATVTAANATASTAAASVAGSTFTLTTGLDAGTSFTGGTANDTFSAQETGVATTDTLTTGDNLQGGTGTDTLSIAVSGSPIGAKTAGIVTAGIEAVAVYNNSTAAYEVDASLMVGLTDVYVNGGAFGTTVSGVASVPNLHLLSTSKAATVTSTVVTGAADEAIILSNSSAQSAGGVTATYNGLEVINFVAAGTTGLKTATVDNSLALVSNALEKVVVTGDADANVTVSFAGAALETQTAEFDASAAGGAITAHVTKGASANATVTMSAQNDYLDFNGALASTITLDGGDGVDYLELDTSVTYSASATAQSGSGVSNFEALRLASGVGVDERSLVNNAGITGLIAAAGGSYTKSTALASITQLSDGTFTTTAATDGAADTLTMNLIGAGVASTLSAANVETLTVNSGGIAANSLTMTAAGSADLTSVTAAGTKPLTVTVSGKSLATVDAAGLTGIGSLFTLTASASTADMTVTGSPNRPVVSATGVANDITVGDGDNTITGGAYRDDITSGDGDNTITAGDGNNQVTTGRGDDTITAGDGDNTINAGSGDNTVTVGDGDNGLTLGNGDDTVTTGGTTTSATVMDVNTVGLGTGDDTFTGGAGRDVVTMGTGDDTVDTGAGADSIYMSDYDDDDVVNGGAGTDALSASALASATAQAVTGAQIQAAAVHVDVTPGTTRTSTPQITGVESVYINANLADANDGAVLDRETVDFASTSGISNLYLLTTDGDAADDSTLILNEVDAAAIHLQDDGAGSLGQLTVVGTGQASLTLKGHDMADSTDLVVSEVDAVTLTSYVDNATAAVTDTVFGNVTADEAAGITVTGAGVSNVIGAQAFSTGTISADAVETLTLNAGSNMTLTTGAIDTAGDELVTIDINVSDDGTMVVPSITATAGDIEASTLTIDVGVGGTFGNGAAPAAIAADSIETATVTVGAAATFRADLGYAGTTTIAASAGSTVDIDNIGLAAAESSVTISGRGDLTGGAGKAFILTGEASLNISGWTDGNAGTVTITVPALSTADATFVGNSEIANVTTLGGEDSVTTGANNDIIDTGAADDTISSGGGNDTIIAGAGDDVINAGAGTDGITGGTGADTMTGGAGTDTFTVATGDTGITIATADTITDFTTADDIIATSLVAGNATIADGSALAAAADSGLAAFIAAADAVLTAGAGVDDAYIAYDAAGTGNAYVVIDEDDSGSVDAGDTFIILTGVNLVTEIVVADIG